MHCILKYLYDKQIYNDANKHLWKSQIMTNKLNFYSPLNTPYGNIPLQIQQQLENTVIWKYLVAIMKVDFLVAGGSIRDTVYSKPISDYDIYVTPNIFNYLVTIGEINQFVINSHSTYKPEYKQSFINGVLKYEENGLKIDIICLANNYSLSEVIQQFPLSISQIACLFQIPAIGHMLLITTDDFETTHKNHIVTYDPDPKYVNYINKIKTKYDDFEFIPQ